MDVNGFMHGSVPIPPIKGFSSHLYYMGHLSLQRGVRISIVLRSGSNYLSTNGDTNSFGAFWLPLRRQSTATILHVRDVPKQFIGKSLSEFVTNLLSHPVSHAVIIVFLRDQIYFIVRTLTLSVTHVRIISSLNCLHYMHANHFCT